MRCIQRLTNEGHSISLLLGNVGRAAAVSRFDAAQRCQRERTAIAGQVLGALRLLDVPVSEMIGRIVIDLRVPRTLLSVLAGAVLAIVGGLLQTTTRNDLADPFYLVSPPAHRRARCW